MTKYKHLCFIISCIFLLANIECQLQLLSPQGYKFVDFVRQFNRNYSSSDQYNQRQIIFQQNYRKILDQQTKANGTYHVTINNFTDWTQAQLNAYFNYKPNNKTLLFSSIPQRLSSALSYPGSLDYRTMSKVSAVKDQGQCGSCWAFATTGLYQSLIMIQANVEYDLAEQFVVDCTSGSSCNGGYPKDAIDMVTQGGIPLQTSYPYKQQNGYYGSTICSASNKVKLNATVTSVSHFSSMTDAQLMQALADHGPIGIGIYASSSFSSYSSGVYSGCPSSSSSMINHAVLLVGYTSNGDWIVKNSWGTNWGQEGFVIISKNADCGLKTFVDVVTISAPAPSPSPSPSPSPDPSPSPSPTPTPDDTFVNYKAYLVDSYGDGWQGLILGIRQGSNMTSTFGSGFTNGSNYGPVNLLVKKNVFADLVVVQYANYTQQISFDLFDENNTLIYSRECRQGTFAANIIFKNWCPGQGCITPNKTSVFVTMLDSWGDGWNGNSIAFRQSGNITGTFGENFTTGHQAGPVEVVIRRGIQAQIIVNVLGTYRNQVGFVIRDTNGVVLLSRMPGTTYYANTIFGTICSTCLNYADVRVAKSDPATDETKDIIDKYAAADSTKAPSSSNSSSTVIPYNSTPQQVITTKTPPQMYIVIGIISFFTLFFMITTIALFVVWRNQRANKFFKLEPQQQGLLNNASGLVVNNQSKSSPNTMRSAFGLNQNKYKTGNSVVGQQLFISV